MTYNKYIAILFLLCSQFCFSQNLIQNGSFEDSVGNSSIEGWDTCCVNNSQYMSFSNDVPFNGGSWSVNLKQNPLVFYLIWYITGMGGTYVYNLTAYARKYYNFFLGMPPFIAIGVLNNNSLGQPHSILDQSKFFDSIPDYWTNITLIDTITTTADDTIAIILYSGKDQLSPDSVSFDLIKLTVTDTISTQNTIISQTPKMTAYPNPFNDHTMITFNNQKHELIQLTLFTIIGIIIRQAETSEDRITVEKGLLSPGIYFYRLVKNNIGQTIGQGKIVIQ